MASILKQDQILIEDFEIKRQKLSIRRDLIQIKDTITFELNRNLKKFYIMLVVYFCIFILSFLIYQTMENLGIPIPTNSAEYLREYLGNFFGLLLAICGSAFGGSIIAEDYARQTGNLLFPKINKARLLSGRLIARFFLMAICLLFFYVLIGIVTFVKYQDLPFTILNSYGWGLFFTFTLLSFVTLISSFMKNTSMTIIFSILFSLIIFEMIPMILSVAGVLNNNELPMFFMLNYYGAIVSWSVAMPVSRYLVKVQGPPGSQFETPSWLTPNEIGAAIGMIIYIIFMLSLAYIIYYRRQCKS